MARIGVGFETPALRDGHRLATVDVCPTGGIAFGGRLATGDGEPGLDAPRRVEGGDRGQGNGDAYGMRF